LVVVGVSALGAPHHQAIVGYVSLAFGALYLAQAVSIFVDRRDNPDPPNSEVGREWTTSDGRRLTVLGIDGDTVRCERWDPLTGVTDAWVGSWDRFQAVTSARSQ
jgi:hypothetical protein